MERRWRSACKTWNESSPDGSQKYPVLSLIPSDSELAAAFADRKKREGSTRGFGIRVVQSTEGSDSWVDDPITRHIISLYMNKEDETEKYILWPFILHMKGPYCILVLPLVEPRHVKEYARICTQSGCGSAVGGDGSISSLLLELPSITGALMVAHALGDIVTGDTPEPEVVVSAPSVGGLLDSLTGSMGITGRPKPVVAQVPVSTVANAVSSGAATLEAPKIGSRPFDKEALRTFIITSMPFGTPLDLNHSNISAIKLYGFASSDLPPAERKQPAWKPYLYKGKQRIIFTIHETVHAALYDRDDVQDSISISGQVNCRAELEGLPDVTLTMTGMETAHIDALSYHPCTQIPEQGISKQTIIFSPPLGNFVLMRYHAICDVGPPVKGFYQLSMVSANEGAFLFKLHLMDRYRSPLTMEFCTVTMPFPRRRVVSLDGTPSIGTVLFTEHSVEWKIITSGRGITGKSVEATFPGTIKFAPWQVQRSPFSASIFGSDLDEDSDAEIEATHNPNLEESLVEKMNKDLLPVDLDEPFCWQAYSYAKVSFKIIGASLTGISIDPKSSVNIFPPVKAPVEFSSQVISGDYILWNTLGKCPSVAIAKA